MHNKPNSKTSGGQDLAALKRPRATGDGRWFWCNQDTADYVIEIGSSTTLLVYLGLCRWHARSGGRDDFHASVANLASATKLGTRTIKRELVLLCRAGAVLTRTGRFSGIGGAHAANTYLLPAPPSATQAQARAKESGFNGPQIEGSLRSKEEPSAAYAPRPADAGEPHAAGDEERIERPWR